MTLARSMAPFTVEGPMRPVSAVPRFLLVARRAAVAAHAATLCEAEQFLNQYIVNTTSGTTGLPGYILFSRTSAMRRRRR